MKVKRTVSAIIFLIMYAVSVFTVCAAFENQPILDKAGYLAEYQNTELTYKLENMRQKYNFDVAIYTEYSMSGYDAGSTADDIFDYQGYGAGDNDDGILLYVSSNPRNYWFTMHGRGETVFTDNGLAYLENKVLPYLRDDDYNSAFEAYAEYTEELLAAAEAGKPYDKKQYSSTYIMCVIGGALLLPLLISYMLMKIKLSQMNTAVKQDYAANYMKQGSMSLNRSQDLFLYSTVIKTAKPKPSSNSGNHTSSSGRSHGGRGGSY